MSYSRDYTKYKKGWYTFNDKKMYLKSSYEILYAQYLEFMRKKKEILDWSYEPDIFYFEGIKRGITNYTPDFKILDKNGNIEYHEVKGYMDGKSKTKINRMMKYYPDVTLKVIGKEFINSLKKWERLF